LKKSIFAVSILLSEKGELVISWLPDGVIGQLKPQIHSKGYEYIDFKILGFVRLPVFVAGTLSTKVDFGCFNIAI